MFFFHLNPFYAHHRFSRCSSSLLLVFEPQQKFFIPARIYSLGEFVQFIFFGFVHTTLSHDSREVCSSK
jgi:hypothetical protein